MDKRLKIPKCFSRILKCHWLQNYRPSKLGAPNNENIPQGKWRKYSVSDSLTSKNAPYLKFGMLNLSNALEMNLYERFGKAYSKTKS